MTPEQAREMIAARLRERSREQDVEHLIQTTEDLALETGETQVVPFVFGYGSELEIVPRGDRLRAYRWWR